MLFSFTLLLTLAAPPVDAGVARSIDTSTWTPKALNTLGKDRFPIDGTLKLPAKTRTSTGKFGEGRKKQTMADLRLPSGLELQLLESSPSEPRDPTKLAELLGQMMTVVEVRRNPHSWLVVTKDERGFGFQTLNWALEPSYGCTSEKSLTAAQLEEAIAVCESLAPAK
jgi:hypothetical protein